MLLGYYYSWSSLDCSVQYGATTWCVEPAGAILLWRWLLGRCDVARRAVAWTRGVVEGFCEARKLFRVVGARAGFLLCPAGRCIVEKDERLKLFHIMQCLTCRCVPARMLSQAGAGGADGQ